MADRFPEPPALAGGKWPREWHNYDGYQIAHQNHMEALIVQGTVLRDTITFREVYVGSELVEINVRGRVETANRRLSR